MRLKQICLSLGLGLAAMTPAAQAADWNNGAGGLKDHGGRAGIPVPAPIPVVETFKWYLRADVGGGVVTGGDPSERGMQYGLTDGDPASTPIGMDSTWFRNGFDTFAVGGVGAGAYITPRLRADATVDVRTKSDVTADGNYSYTGNPAVYDAITYPSGVQIRGSTVDKTDVHGTLALLNFYYDLTDRGTRFTPYIGLGVGAILRSMQRSHSSSEEAHDLASAGIGAIPGTARTYQATSKSHQLAPAVAATAGFAYTLDTGMVLDFNYRFAYLGGVDFATRIDPSSISRLTIDDTMEHALRAGVRWNVW